MSFSIRRRLLLWLSPILLVTGFGAAMLIRFNVEVEIDELFDKVLMTMAYSLRNSEGALQNLPTGKSAPPDIPDLDLISQIWSQDGHLLYRSHGFAPLPYQNTNGWTVIAWRGELWRVFNLKTPEGLIQIAQTKGERVETADEITTELIVPLLVLVPGLSLLIWFGIGRGLRPLRDITQIVRKRNPDSLHPIPN